MQLNKYLTSDKRFDELLYVNSNTEKRYISLLMQFDPRIEEFFVKDYNAEQYLIFCSRIKRLESSRDVIKKCQKNIYPNDWIYDFGPAGYNYAFLRRYLDLWGSVKKDFQEKKKYFHFEEVAKITDDTITKLRKSFEIYRLIINKIGQLEDRIDELDSADPVKKKLKEQLRTLKQEREFFGYNDPLYQDLVGLFERIAQMDKDASVFLEYMIGECSIYKLRSKIKYSNHFYTRRGDTVYVEFRKILRFYDNVPYLIGYYLSDFQKENEPMLEEAKRFCELQMQMHEIYSESSNQPAV